MRRRARLRKKPAGEVLLETLSAADWFTERLPISLETLNNLLFRDAAGNPDARAALERAADDVLEQLTAPGFDACEPASGTLTITPAKMQRFHKAALERYALAEARPEWEGVDVAERIELANRLFLSTAARFALIQTRLFAGAPVPPDAPFEWCTAHGRTWRLRVDLISPVPGYQTLG